MTLKYIKKIKWQLYITREVNFASEYFMHEGWISFTKRIFGYPILKRINLYENGVASIFVSEEDIKKYIKYIQNAYRGDKLQNICLDSMKNCKEVQSWIETLKFINYQSLSNLQLFGVYNELRKQNARLGPSLMLPRLVELALTSINSWQKNSLILDLLKNFSELNELRRNVVSDQMFKEWLSLFKEIGARSRISTKEALFLLPNEIKILLKSDNQARKNKIKSKVEKRVAQCLFITIDGKTKSYEEGYGDLKSNLLNKMNVFEEKKVFGRKACGGKVYGKAVVVLKESDYKKVKKGDILITTMTQPEIGRVLGKIAGIITDEGGMLAHASILAREQKIPCLIATKKATTIVKDGDQIKLDASNSFFEIISSKNEESKQISYESVAWDVKKRLVKKQTLKINLYESKNPGKLIVWLPGMSDKPSADKENPLLKYFVSRAIKKNYSVAIIAFPGTLGCGFIEERTIKTMRQNVKDALDALFRSYPKYLSIEKILIGRSAGGTLASSILDKGFKKCVIIAGRLKTLKLAKIYISTKKDYIPFGKLQPFIQTRINYVNKNGNKMYYQNKFYIKELSNEEVYIGKVFKKTSQLKIPISILGIQALDDKIVPFQLNQWKLLAEKFSLPIEIFPIKYSCGHSFANQPAISGVTNKILKFIN